MSSGPLAPLAELRQCGPTNQPTEIPVNKTKIVHCDCNNEYQDSQYGPGMRVTTPANIEQAKGGFVVRCTVCGKSHNLGQLK